MATTKTRRHNLGTRAGRSPEAASRTSVAKKVVTTLTTAAASSAQVQSADILIQAGHVNTPDRMTGASGPFGEERVWTRIVRDEAVRILSNYGLNVLSTDASWKLAPRGELLFRTKIAVYLHFDGDKEDHHTEGASVGYPAGRPPTDGTSSMLVIGPFNGSRITTVRTRADITDLGTWKLQLDSF